VDADREPTGAGVEIVAGERALPARIEPAAGIERERVRRDDDALAERGEHLRRPVLPAQSHCRSRWTGLPCLTGRASAPIVRSRRYINARGASRYLAAAQPSELSMNRFAKWIG
jgi:hypothetical protein